MKRVLGLVTMVAVAAAACSGGARPGRDEPLVIPIEGTVNLLRGDDGEEITEPASLHIGDIIETAEGGRAQVIMPGEQSVELAPQSVVEIQGTNSPALLRGSVLVEAPGSLDLPFGELAVRGEDALLRLTRGVSSLQIGVYTGVVQILGSAFDDEIPPLRRLAVILPTGAVPYGPRPLDIRPNKFDAWDSRILGRAIDIGIGLQQLREGIAAQLPTRGRRAIIEHILPGKVRQGFPPGVFRARPAADVLVAGAVSVTATRPALSDEVGRVLQQVLTLRDVGASWIVVAAEWALSSSSLGLLARLSGLLVELLQGASLAEILAEIGALGPPGGATPPGGGPPEPPGPPPGEECTIEGVCPPDVPPGPPEPPPVPPDPPEPPGQVCTIDLLCQLIDDILDPPPGG